MEKLKDLPQVVRFCKEKDFPADIVGRWVWLRFPSKPDEGTRTLLKGAGFRWVKTRGEWAHNCGHPSRRGNGEPRWKYGAVPVSGLDENDL